MKLFLYRLSLTELDQAELSFDDDPSESRKSFLSRMLNTEFDFESRKGKFLRFKPTQDDDGVVAGAVCRWMPESYEGDPADPFEETDGGRWARAALFINLNDDQQVVGIEREQPVGKPRAVIKALVSAINDRTGGRPYRVDAFSINVDQSFQQAIANYSGPITSLTFELVLPNPTDGEGATKEALKRLKDKVDADRAKATIQSADGLSTDAEMVEDAVKYAQSGGGDVVAKDGRHIVYSSKNTVKSVEADESLRPTGGFIEGLKDRISGVLKR